MSNTVDNRIVSLEFDNSRYDKNVNQSINTTDKLKSALKFQDVETGFERINKAITRVTFTPIEKGVETVYAKFTMLERFTIQAYDRIANKIIDTGKRIANETFAVPTSTGFNEYEQKMDSINVMMNSTGESLETVNEELEKLNLYADKTIYSFSDMTNSIGKFTNNGVKLKDATQAIMGISNAAALAGSTTQQASSAMYNFSQALSLGYLGLMDWKSIELAGMATIGFKNQLIETGKELGTLVDKGNGLLQTLDGTTVSADNFRETLQKQWITNEVLLKTLQKYSDETTEVGAAAGKAAQEVRTFTKMVDALKEALQSGWSQTWELLIGDMQKATQLWTSINDVLSKFIERITNARNGLIKTWKSEGGQTAAWNAFVNILHSVASVLETIKEAFRAVFPPITGKRLTEFSILFEKFTRKMTPSTRTLEYLKRAFTGVFSVIGIVSDAFKAFGKAMLKPLGLIWDTRDGVFSAAATMGDWLTNLRKTIKEGRVFETVFGGLAKGLSTAINAVKIIAKFIKDLIIGFKEKGFTGVFEVIKGSFTSLLKHIRDSLDSFAPLAKVKDLGSKISRTIENWPVIGTVYKFIVGIKNAILSGDVFTAVPKAFKSLVSGVGDSIEGFRDVSTDAADDFKDRLSKKFEPIKNIFIGLKNLLSGLFKFIGSLVKMIGAVGKHIFDALAKVFDGVTDTMSEMTVGEASLAFAAGSLGTLLLSISKAMKNVSGILGGVQSITQSIANSFNSITKMVNAKALKQIAISIGVLTASLVVLSAIPINKLSAATAVITALFYNLVTVMKTYSGGLNAVSSFGISKGGVSGEGPAATITSMGIQIALIAGAVMTLVTAMAIISLLPYENLVKGVAVLELLLYSIANVTKKMAVGEKVVNKKKGTKVKTEAVNVTGTLLAMGVAINMIVGALIKMMAAILLLTKFGGSDGYPMFVFAMGSLILLITLVGELIVKITKAAVHNRDMDGKKINSMAAMISSTLITLAIFIHVVVRSFLLLAAEFAALKTAEDVTGKGDASKAFSEALTVMVSFIGMIVLFVGAFVAAIVALSKKLEAGGIASTIKAIGGLVAMMILMQGFILELVGAMLALTLIAEKFPDSFAAAGVLLFSILGVVSALMFAMSKFVEAKTMQDWFGGGKGGGKGVGGALKTFALTLITLSASLALFAYALANLAKVPWKQMAKGGVVLLAAISLITGLTILAGKSKALQTGLGYIGEILLDIGAAVGVVALSFLGIMAAFKILSRFTDEELENAINNFRKFIAALRELAPEIAVAVADLAGMAIGSLLMSVGQMIEESLDEIFQVLVDGLSRAIKYGPQIVANLLSLIEIVLDGITAKAPEITAALIVTLISIINGLANAIDDHRKEILDAVDRLFDAVAGVVTEALGRLMGKTGASLNKFVDLHQDAVSGIAKIALSYAGVIKGFDIFHKATSGINNAVSAVQSLSAKYKSLRQTIQAVSIALESAIKQQGGGFKGLIKVFKSTGDSGVAMGQRIGNAIKSIGPELAISAAVIIGNALKEVIQHYTDAMDAANGYYDEVHTKSREALEELKEYRNNVADFGKVNTEVMKSTKLGESYLESLKGMVDSSGKIKAGYEEQAESLLPKINEYLGENIIIEDGRLKMLNDQNEAIDLQANKLDELAKARKLEAQRTALQSEYESSIEITNDKEIAKRINDARKAMMAANARGDDDEVRNQLNIMKEEQYRLERAKAFLKTYEDYSKALDNNNLDLADSLYTQMATGTMTMSENAAFLYEELEDAAKSYEAYKDLVAAGIWEQDDEYEKQVLKQMSDLYDEVEKKASDDAETLSGYNILTRLYSGEYAFLGKVAKIAPKMAGPNSKQKALTSGYYITDESQKKEIEDQIYQIQGWFADAIEGNDIGTVPGTWEFYQNYAYALVSLTDQAKQELIRQHPELKDAFEELAKMGPAGFADGIKSGDEEVHDAAGDLAETFLTVFTDEFQINSPSKVMYDYGIYATEGFTNAVRDQIQKTAITAKLFARAVLTAFSTDLGSSPMIQPVIGAPAIGTTWSDFQTLASGIFPLSSNLSATLADGIDISPIVKVNEDLLNIVTLLRDDMAAMHADMTNLKVVMNADALVGQIVAPMDTALGLRAGIKALGG